MKLPDLYITHDVLEHLGIHPAGAFKLLVTFANPTTTPNSTK
jgi:hypothetical protein